MNSNNYYDELIGFFAKYDFTFNEDSIESLKSVVIQNFVLLTQDIIIWVKAYNQVLKLGNTQIALFLTKFMEYKTQIELMIDLLYLNSNLSYDFLSTVYRWSIFDYSIILDKEEQEINALRILNESAKVILPFVKTIDGAKELYWQKKAKIFYRFSPFSILYLCIFCFCCFFVFSSFSWLFCCYIFFYNNFFIFNSSSNLFFSFSCFTYSVS